MEDPFQPTWPRVVVAAALAALGFALPQKIPLEYRSLNDPSPGLLYLEITCAANAPGLVKVFSDTGKGYNGVEVIEWPVSPTDMAFTYTFPLADAPLAGLRVVPFADGHGALTITSFRIIDRSGLEIHRFSREDFQPSRYVAVEPAAVGWRLVVAPLGAGAHSDLRLPRPVVAEGMNVRNLERCLISWGYLGGMIWILLLAAYAVLRRFAGFRGALRACAYLALVAVLFSAVGNRGLIRNSIRFAAEASRAAKP